MSQLGKVLKLESRARLEMSYLIDSFAVKLKLFFKVFFEIIFQNPCSALKDYLLGNHLCRVTM